MRNSDIAKEEAIKALREHENRVKATEGAAQDDVEYEYVESTVRIPKHILEAIKQSHGLYGDKIVGEKVDFPTFCGCMMVAGMMYEQRRYLADLLETLSETIRELGE